MPRTYKPSGTRQYKKYNDLLMQAALSEYENTNKSLTVISTKYEIPKSVLHRHNTRFMKKQGGQTVLSAEAEEYIVENLNYCSEWGYPLDTYDLRILVKGYLDRAGITERRFKDNLPGPDFVKGFLRRNKEKISLRLSQNIKRSRASVSPEAIEMYFTELEKSLEGVPMSNVVNYDETNLSDDPGRRKVITKRGAKYPERVMNHSKAATSVMMAASGDGTLLPCYVVYKAKNLYETWVQNGPKGCRYNCTTSGWFDSLTFQDWVRTVALPYFKDKEGKKVLIGDNLSSHLSLEVIRECKEQNVDFIFLPPNSTHLTQPLDVAFFRPLKGAWRDILFSWKKTDGRTLATIPKSVFPSLLRKLIEHTDCQTKSNILAGFMKAGISPLNKIKVLERLPGHFQENQALDKNSVDATVKQMLKEMRYGTFKNISSSKRKKIQIKPGQSVCTESDTSDIEEYDESTRIISSNEESTKCYEDHLLPDKTTKPKPQFKSAKEIPEDRKRKFEEKAAQIYTKSACAVVSSVPNKQQKICEITKVKPESDNEPVFKKPINMKIYGKNIIKKGIKEQNQDSKERAEREDMKKYGKNIMKKELKVQKQENETRAESENMKKYGKNTIKKETKVQKQENKKTAEGEDTEKDIFLDSINNMKIPDNIDDMDFGNMPLVFADDFEIDEEIEVISEIEEENKENTINIKENELVDISLKDTKENIIITSVENLTNKKVFINFNKNKKISVGDTLKIKPTRKNNNYFYKKDEDIARDLMDSSV